jgi:hypothetical protein
MDDCEWSKCAYLIIAGTTKAGTTSLHHYLGDHPEVCVSNLKETRFFLDPDYPLVSKYRYDTSPDKYGDFFSPGSPEVKLWVDATPDYLYSSGTAARIHAALENVRIVFLLREPISRVVSWYRFALQNNSLDSQISLDSYARQQLDQLENTSIEKPQYLRVVEEGCYARYLKSYFQTFGRDKIFVTFLEDLSKKPADVMQRLAEFAGIDKKYYQSYQFEIFNKTMDLKTPALYALFRKFRRTVNRRIHRLQFLRTILRSAKRQVAPFFVRINSNQEPREFTFSEDVHQALLAYYAPANRELQDLLDMELPWG